MVTPHSATKVTLPRHQELMRTLVQPLPGGSLKTSLGQAIATALGVAGGAACCCGCNCTAAPVASIALTMNACGAARSRNCAIPGGAGPQHPSKTMVFVPPFTVSPPMPVPVSTTVRRPAPEAVADA